MKTILVALLALLNGAIAYAQIAPNPKILQLPAAVKPVLQTLLDTLNNQRDTAKKAVPVAIDSVDALYRHLPDVKENTPLYILNSAIISNLNLINPKDITGLNILKDDAELPANFKNLKRYGVVSVTLKAGVKIKTKSFKEIGRWLDVKGPVKYAVDGFFIDDETMLIATNSILGLDVVLNKFNDAEAGATINVWTLTPPNRKGLLQMKRPADKPGVIYIRGLASK